MKNATPTDFASYLEVLDAQLECQTAEQQLVQLKYAQQLAEVQLFKAIGRGITKQVDTLLASNSA